jgi:hypothetical protein
MKKIKNLTQKLKDKINSLDKETRIEALNHVNKQVNSLANKDIYLSLATQCRWLYASLKHLSPKKWKEQYTETRTSDLKAKEILTEGQYNHYLKLLRNGIITT